MNKEVRMSKKPRILVWDIETSPIIANVWGLKDQNIALNQVIEESTIICWAAKWLGEDRIYQEDVGHQRDKRNDKNILKNLWKLINEADIHLTQNGVEFDLKVANGRFLVHDMPPPSKALQLDTLKISRQHFKLLSHKLEYMTGKLVPDNKKDSHGEFPGMALWTECMDGNPKAWKAMRKYNVQDVIALEKLYAKLAPWQDKVDMRVFTDGTAAACSTCTSNRVQYRGYKYTKSGKFRRIQCLDCGHWSSESGAANNLLSQEKRASLRGEAKPKARK